MAHDITAVDAALGAYCRENWQKIFLNSMYRPSQDKLTVWDIVEPAIIKDELAYSRAAFDMEIRGADDDFVSQGDVVTWDADKVKIRNFQTDFPMSYETLKKSWLHHLYTAAKIHKRQLTLADLPFEQWFFENAVMKFMDNFFKKTSFLGVYDATVNYALPVGAPSWASATDGVLKILVDAITATNLVPVTTGATTSSNALDNFKTMADAIPDSQSEDEWFLLCSRANTKNYNKDFSTTHNAANHLINDDYKRFMVETEENVTIVPVPEMGSSDRLILTRRNNLIWASEFNKDEDPQIIHCPSGKPKIINVTIEYSSGFQIGAYDQIIVNDVV